MSSNFELSHQKINKNIDNQEEKFKYSQIFAVAQFTLHNMFWIGDFWNFMYFLVVVQALCEKKQEIKIKVSLYQLTSPNC